LPVISMTLAIDVRGAWAATANTAPMANDTVYGGRSSCLTEEVVGYDAESRARHGSGEQRWGEDAA
jgi:hypothetical protein